MVVYLDGKETHQALMDYLKKQGMNVSNDAPIFFLKDDNSINYEVSKVEIRIAT